MKKIIAFLFVAGNLVAGCNPQQTLKEKQAELAGGKIDENFKYTCNDVGWETYLPKNWNLLTKEETKQLNEKGRDVLEKTTGNAIEMSGLKELVNLKKDVYNSFLSTIEKYDSNEMGSYNDHNNLVDRILKDAYTYKKIKFESKTGNERIDNVEFHTLETKIYSPNSIKIVLTQKMFSALLKGYDFAMTINYNNEDDKQTLMKIVMGSKFL